MIDQLKFENIGVFQKVEYNSKFLQETQGQIKENKLNPEFKPNPLTTETAFQEIKTFLRFFSTYINSGEQSPGISVFKVASDNVDSFWRKMFEEWAFNQKTTLQEFIFMLNSVANNRFSVHNRGLELFCLQQKNEDEL